MRTLMILFCVMAVLFLSNHVQAEDCMFSVANMEKCKTAEKDPKCIGKCLLKNAGTLKEGGALNCEQFITEMKKCPGPSGGPPGGMEIPDSMKTCLADKGSKCNENDCDSYQSLKECFKPPQKP